MGVQFLTACFIYLVVGGCTFYTLTRLRMFTARKFYVIAFFVLLSYLAVYICSGLWEPSLPFTPWKSFLTYVRLTLRSSDAWSVYLTYPVMIATVMSLFMCLSAILVALTAAVSVARILIGKRAYLRRICVRQLRLYKSGLLCLRAGRRLSELCRYNC